MTGTQISNMTPEPTIPDGAVVPFVVPPGTVGFDAQKNYIYDLGADLLNRVSYTALAAPAAAAQVGRDGGGTVQGYIDDVALAGDSTGSALVAFKQVGAGSIALDVQEELRRSVSADQFGAVGNGVTDDTAAIVAAQTALVDQGGGTLFFTRGKTYKATGVPMVPGVTYAGSGRSDINQIDQPGAKLQSATGNIFVNTGSTISAVQFEDLWIESLPGGGHIFDWSSAGLVAKVEISGVTLVQNNIGKSIVNGTSAGGVFSIWMHDFEYKFADGNTVPALLFQAPTVNSITIERFWSTPATALLASNYSILIESTNPGGGAINCFVRDGVFEQPRGGCVRMLSCVNSAVEDSAGYDLLVAPDNEAFYLGKGASGPPSAICWFKGVRSTTGTTGKPDFKVDSSVVGQGTVNVDCCSFAYADGGGALPVTNFRACDIANYQNIAYTSMGASPGLDLHFGTTAGGASRSWTIWNGYAGNNDGHLNFSLNGSRVGSFSGGGLLTWAGTAGNPHFYVDTTGEIRTKQPFYPPKPDASYQSATRIYADSAAPTTGAHTVGEIVFNNAPAAAGTIGWVCTTSGTPGTWKTWGTIAA